MELLGDSLEDKAQGVKWQLSYLSHHLLAFKT
jgi:hypothetical protein